MIGRAIAGRLMDHAARVMPPADRTWVAAMRAELDHIPGSLAACAFALGCVQAGYRRRIEDMMTVARVTRWTLAALALAWAGFFGLAVVLVAGIQADPAIKPIDLGVDPGTDETLRIVQAYPVWLVAAAAATAVVLAFGAVLLARRMRLALPALAVGVAAATLLTLASGQMLESSALSLAIPLIALVPVWWLSRRAPDLKTAG